MTIAEAQREVRTVYVGGFYGQLVSGGIWLASSALTTWLSRRAGIIALVFGGMLIYPLTQLLLRATGNSASLPPGNPFRELAIEIAFLVPLLLPLVAAATIHTASWFYPAMMVVVGAHYLPFSFLYGMRQFIPLSGLLLVGGILIGLYVPGMAVCGGWFTGIVLFIFAFIGRAVASPGLDQ